MNSMDALKIVERCTTAAIATDAENRVVGLNDAAKELFGFNQTQVFGREFARVFQPRDVYGNPFLYDYSLIFQMLESGQPLRNFECNLLKSCGEYQRTAVSVIVILGPNAASYELVHILWPRDGRRKADEAIAHLLAGNPRLEVAVLDTTMGNGDAAQAVLTRRQTEILRLLANGSSGGDIAENLHLSPETVRNHIRNILARLGVHSRVEAVSVAYRRHLI